ncbi:MAG: hypothetical protein IKL32_00290 [Alphaproteobacteria bacterium]|nr:hypothetical protein [Alphaproteobacteria bacterium]
MFSTKKQVLDVLSHIPSGHERRLFLEQTNARDFLISIGSNVTLYQGNPTVHSDILTYLSSVYVLLIKRRNKNGEFDGIGALGGLSECLDENHFSKMTYSEKQSAIGVWDNVIQHNNQIILTQDKQIITFNNIQREIKEELSDIGLYHNAFEWDKMVKIPLICQDDDYLIYRWEPKQEARIIEPQCHVMPITQTLADYLLSSDSHYTIAPKGELFGFEKISLSEALFQIAPLSDTGYCYSHEWLTAWFLAFSLLTENTQRTQLLDLLKTVPSFEDMCYKIHVQPAHICRLLLSKQNGQSLTHHKIIQNQMVQQIHVKNTRINNP